jgi:hypothetical protein
MTDLPTPTPDLEPATVAQLMQLDPLSLSNQDLDRIIESLRASRAKFVLGNVKAGTPPAKKNKTQLKEEAALEIAGGKLDLGALGLDL